MTTQYAGQDIWVEDISHTTDDDVRDASSISIGDIGLADRTRYLKNRGFYSTPAFGVDPYTNTGTYRIAGKIIFTNIEGAVLKFEGARIYERVAHANALYNSATWTPGFGLVLDSASFTQTALNTAANVDAVTFYFELPDNITLKKVSVRLQPVNTHIDMPVTKPRIDVFLTDAITGNTVTLASQTDPTLSFAQYNLPHKLIATLPDTTCFAGRSTLFVRIYGENDTFALTGLIIGVPYVEYTCENLGEEFGTQIP